MIHINSLSGQTTKRIAYIVALAVFIINLTLAMQATSMLPIVDGWAVLNRIMHYNFGELSWDQYLFRPHGAHLHFIVYAVAWLDYHFFDGQQKLMQAVSLGATALFCLIIVTLIIRQGLRTKTPSLVVALAAAATVAILSGIADSETMLHPFQVVLSAARLSYIVLIWVLIRALIEQNKWLYFTTIAISSLAVSFHGVGYIFAICVILTHLLVCRNRWWMAISLLPLLSVIIIQAHYSQGGGELAHLSSILNMHALLAFFPAVFAYFASPMRLLSPLIGVHAVLLIGFVLFFTTTALTLTAVIKILGLRSWSLGILWQELLLSRANKKPEREMVFFTVLGLFILAAGVAAALFWIVRTSDPSMDQQPYVYVLNSARYGAFVGLAYVMLIAVCLRFTGFTNKGQPSQLLGTIGVAVILLILISTVWSSIRALQTYDIDDQLNNAAAGISLGLSPIQPEAEAIWTGARGDWYWAKELPSTVTYLRTEHKGVWHDLPTIGANGGAFYAGYPINNVKRLTVASDKSPGRCSFSGTISSKDVNFHKVSLLLPVAAADGKVNGYAALTRLGSDQAERLVKGFVLCPKGSSEETPLFLAHDIKDTPSQNISLSTRGMGARAILPLSDMKGELLCALESKASIAAQNDTLVLTIKNLSAFDWKFNEGRFPLRVGVHLFNLDGTTLRWDDGFRVPIDAYITSNGSVEIHFPLAGLSLKGVTKGQREVVTEFGLVQDGHAWFSGLSCKTVLHK